MRSERDSIIHGSRNEWKREKIERAEFFLCAVFCFRVSATNGNHIDYSILRYIISI